MNNELNSGENLVDAAKDRLVSDLNMVLVDTSDLLKHMGASSNHELAAARKKLAARLDEVQTRVAAASASLGDKTREAMNVSDGYVRENPWKALGVVAAGGILFGFLLNRR